MEGLPALTLIELRACELARHLGTLLVINFVHRFTYF